MGFYFRAVLIASCFGLAVPAYAQVRVITGDIEHFYGHGGQLLDDAELRARNERIERARQIEKIRREAQRRQEELDAARRQSQAQYDQAISDLNERIERSRSKSGWNLH
jgi:predicted secreted Zn-dependent protease